MRQEHQLPWLIKLLDDESEKVRETVLRELALYGTGLEVDLQRLEANLRPDSLNRLIPILRQNRRPIILNRWTAAFDQPGVCSQIEHAYNLIAWYLNPGIGTPNISLALDSLTHEYSQYVRNNTVEGLCDFLFNRKNFRGARKKYDNPANSDLFQVLQCGTGIPITLSAIFVLVGDRVGLHIEGCNFPGHFLVKTSINSIPALIDCYNKGRFILRQDMNSILADSSLSFDDIIEMNVSGADWMARVLRNLLRAFQSNHDDANVRFMNSLLQHTPSKLSMQKPTEFIQIVPRFKPGQIVKHQAYGYRGLVVDCDTSCKADETWYWSNVSQPDRNQPWYHVLVDGARHTTYVAQSNLMPDPSPHPIEHPLLSHFFEGFSDGFYKRNSTPWPSN